MNRKKRRFFLLGIIIVVITLILIFSSLRKGSSSSEGSKSEPAVLASVEIGRSFVFLAEDEAGGKDNEISLSLTLVKKSEKVAIKGQPIEADEEKVFLVLDFEMENETDEPLFLYPPNLIRLVGEEGKKFAPDLHNDIARVEPISVKKDKMGFIVTKEENDFILLVGEIEGEKEEVAISF